MSSVFSEDSSANVKEKNSDVVRTAFGLHVSDQVFDKLVRHPRFVGARARNLERS
jgi:ectoine hydroxylase